MTTELAGARRRARRPRRRLRAGRAAERRVLAGFAEHRSRRPISAPRPASGGATSQPTGTLELVAAGPTTAPGPPGRARGAPTCPRRPPRGARGRARTSASAGPSGRVELAAGRYEVVLPPDAVADLCRLIEAVGLGPRGRGRPQRLLGARAAGPASARRSRRSPFALRERPGGRGLECAAVPRRRGVGPGRLGLRQRAPRRARRTGSHEGRLDAAALPPRRRRPLRRRRSRPRSTTSSLELPGAAARSSTSSSPAPNGGCSSPACGTSARSTRRRCCSRGSTRDGVYLVEHGEIVGAVNNFRFNESPVDLLARTIEAGTDRAGAVAGVGRVDEPHGDAAAPGRRTST